MIKYGGDRAIIYHWWCESDKGPYHDWENPVVASIGVLRAHNPEVPVYLIDCSRKKRPISDWGPFPKLLNFKVIPWDHYYEVETTSEYHGRLCSRVWDVWKVSQIIPEDEILFCDADIFWLANPYPLIRGKSNRLCCSGNTGIFYYHKKSEMVRRAFETWKAHITLARYDLDFRKRVREVMTNCYTIIQDEVIFGYLSQTLPGFHVRTPWEENCIIDMFRYHPQVAHNAKNAHALKESVGPARGKLCLCFEEFRRALEKTVGKDGFKMLFAGETDAPLCVPIRNLRRVSRKELLNLLAFTEHKYADQADLSRPGKKGWFQHELNMRDYTPSEWLYT